MGVTIGGIIPSNTEETIILSKKLKGPHDGSIRKYVLYLEELVEDLSSTLFDRNVRLEHKEQHYASCYGIDYGTITRKDMSGAPKEKTVWGSSVYIKTLEQLRKHIKKAKETENPDFKILYENLGSFEAKTFLDKLFGPWTTTKPHGWYERVQKIILNERDSSTYVTATLRGDGLAEIAEIQFVYDTRCYDYEKHRIWKSIARLNGRGYKTKSRR